MLSDDSFLQTVFAHPDDDGPRLVYADWLEERGECARAELIRLQCLGGGERRACELIDRCATLWAGPAARHAYSYAFRRGFVEEVTVEAGIFIRHAEEIFAASPIQLLRIIGARGTMDRLFDMPLLTRVRALHLTDCHLGNEGAVVISNCPYLDELRTLRLGCNSIQDRGVEYLADSPYLNKLNTLVLRGNLIGDAGAQVLALADGLSSLCRLDLSDNQIGDAGAEAIANSSHFPSLTCLDLSSQFKGWSAGHSSRGRPYPIQPKQQKALKARFGPQACTF